METRKTSWNLDTFFASLTFISAFENSQNLLSCPHLLLWSILVWGTLEFVKEAKDSYMLLFHLFQLALQIKGTLVMQTQCCRH